MSKILMATLALVLAFPVFADTTATAGAGAASNAGAAAGAVSGGSVTTITSSTVANVPDPAAFSPASIILNGCQEGMSGQSTSAGAGIGFESAPCVALRQASEHQKLMLWYEARGDKNSAALHHRHMMHYVSQADQSADVTHYPKVIGSTLTSLLPLGLIFLLF